MHFRIAHETLYRYSEPVRLGPHVFRLRPREDGSQRLIAFDLDIVPAPSLWSDCLDADGNVVRHAWFIGQIGELRVRSRFEVETLRTDPLDYEADPAFDRLPAAYPESSMGVLAPCRAPSAPDASVRAFAEAIAQASSQRMLPFLAALTQAIHDSIRRDIRLEGQAQTPAQTLATRSGACRDLTLLFMEVCRAQGIAARFVSGYWRGELGRPERHLHAWAEVYVPGGGWRGYDPTHRMLVSDQHVPLAAAATQAGAMPVEGLFYSAGARSRLEYKVEIEAD